MKAETCNRSEMCTETTYRSSFAALGFLMLASSAHSALNTLSSWQDGSGGATSWSACLSPCPRLQLLGKEVQRKENRSLSLVIQLPGLSYLFRALSLSHDSGPLIISELYSLLLPWLGSPTPVCEVSIKPSDEQFSLTSSAALPQDTAAIADTWQRCRAAGSPFNGLPIQNGC